MKRVALITGGSRGIGFGIARCLAQEGLDLAVCGTRPAENAARVLELLQGLGSEVLYIQADVSQKAMRSAMLQRFVSILAIYTCWSITPGLPRLNVKMSSKLRKKALNG